MTLRRTDVCRKLWQVKRSCNFSFVTTNLHHDIFSLTSLINLTREELANIVLDYQHKFDNSLGSINAELLELKTKFTKMESDLTISRNVNVKLMERLVATERKCWANEQYSKRECLEISGIPESVSDNTLEDIDAKVDKENIESCHRLKGKGSKGRVKRERTLKK